MAGPQTGTEWRFAEALALEKLHGADAPRFIAQRIGELAVAGDYAGIERLQEIGTAYDEIMMARRQIR